MKRRARSSLRYSIAVVSGVLATLVCFVAFELVSLLALRDAGLRENDIREHLVRKARARIQQSVQGETERVGIKVRAIGASREFSDYLLGHGDEEWFRAHVYPTILENDSEVSGIAIVGPTGALVVAGGEIPAEILAGTSENKLIKNILEGGTPLGVIESSGKLYIVAAAPITPLMNRQEVAGGLLFTQLITKQWLQRSLRDPEVKLLFEGSGTVVGEDFLLRVGARPTYSRSITLIRESLPAFTKAGAWIPVAAPVLTGYSPVVVSGFISNEALLPLGIQAESVRMLPRIVLAALVLGLLVGFTMFFIVTLPLRKILSRVNSGESIPTGLYEVDSVADAIENTHDELRRGVLLKDSVLSSIREGFQLIGPEGRCVDVNRALCGMVGVSKDDFLKCADPFFYLDEEARSNAQEFLEMLTQDEYLAKAGFEGTLVIPGLSPRALGVRLSAIEPVDSEGICVAVLIIDRSVEKEAQIESKKQEQMQMLGEFAAGVAHNINNLLTGIIGAVSVLESPLRKQTPDVEAKLHTSIRTAALQGASLTKELLNISRIKEGRLGRSPVDVRKVVRDVVGIAEGLDVAKGYTIQIALPETPLMALCEESGLNQVLLNLIANALDSMAEPGIILVRGLTRQEPTGPVVSLAVVDGGTGMTPEVRQRIFEPFFTTKKGPAAGKKVKLGGSGLGLSSAFAIVRSWGGDLSCESEVGKGTTFTVVLPSAVGESRQARKSELVRNSGVWVQG